MSSPFPQSPTPASSRPAVEAAPLRFAALRYPNFRLFWSGNLLSNVGTFAQQTAQGWLVRSITHDASQAATNLSLVTACGTLPILLLTLYAGVLADRVDKRRALILTNGGAALIAIMLAILVGLGHVEVWHVMILAACTGTVNAFDIPIRQSFNREMVEPEDIPNAIAMNSSAFNAARVAGPAVGGLLLRFLGLAACFWTNAFSYLAMLAALSLQKLPPHQAELEKATMSDVLNDARDGLRYVMAHPVLRATTILVAFVSLTTMSFGTLLPMFAKDVFHSDARGFATLMTCNGLGALVAAVALAAAGQMRHRGKRLLLGAFGFCLSVATFAFSPHLFSACAALIAAGWFLLTFLMTANTFVQTLCPDELRGRVFSVYSLALIGTAPIGAIFVGQLARALGPRHAVAACALSAALFTFGLWARHRRSLWKER